MSRYLLSRKQLDTLIVYWEQQHSKELTKESLQMFIVKKQALHMANELLNDGILSEKLERFKRELEFDSLH